MINYTFAYIDPGTGAMLFSVIIGLVSAGYFAVQKLIMKLKFVMSGGRSKAITDSTYPYVIFSDSKRYWNVFKPICDEFEKRQIKCEYWTASPDDPALDEKYEYVHCEFIGEGNKAYARLNVMSADVVLATTPGLDVYQWKRSQNVKHYAHILHEVGGTTEYRMFGIDYYDSILLSGEFQIEQVRKLEELRKLPAKGLEVVGSTMMDSMLERVSELTDTKDDITTILLAPSWGESCILNRYGSSFIDELVKTGYRIIIRPHPQMAISDPKLLAELKEKYPDSDMLSWNSDNDNLKVLSKADLLISDFSGVIFDYTLIFNRPMMYADAQLDLSPYDAAWLEGPVWRQQVLPKLGRRLDESEFSDMKAIIDDMLTDDKAADIRKYVSDTAWQHKGEAAQKTVDCLLNVRECLENI